MKLSLARILSILIVVFFSLFILEGFSPEFSWIDSLMHLLFALFVLGITIIGWKWPKIGGWIFIIFSLVFLIPVIMHSNWQSLMIGIIPLIIGILFLIEKRK